jgi:hypothetical protein
MLSGSPELSGDQKENQRIPDYRERSTKSGDLSVEKMPPIA